MAALGSRTTHYAYRHQPRKTQPRTTQTVQPEPPISRKLRLGPIPSSVRVYWLNRRPDRRERAEAPAGRSRVGWVDSVAVRLLLPSVALTVLLLVVFFAQRDATSTLSQNVRAQARAEQGVSRAYQSETLLLDLETGVRGFLLTHDRQFLEPWRSARSAFPVSSSVLVGLEARGGTVELGLARRIQSGGESYIRDFAVPEIRAVEANPGSVASLAAALEGKRRVDALRPL